MSIELPRDAEGREIPLDTEVLYDLCKTKVSVKEFLFRTLVESQKTEWTIKAQYEGNMYYNSFKPKDMYLTPPDSWEKLLEDLSEAGDQISTAGKQMPTTTHTSSTAESVRRPARLSPGTRSSRMSADGTRRAKHGTRGCNDY